MKRIIILTILFFAVVLFPSSAEAKMLPQAKTGRAISVRQSVSTGITVNPKLRDNRKALLVYFGNLQNATNVSYTLIYKTNGREEGAGGSIRQSEGNTTSRELLFGTCSKNVCTYHTNITNMKLEVTGQLKSGKTFTKRYRIKV